DVGLVSDAGMPAISDPGYEVVKAALEEKLKVVTLPGANAALCALVSSGLSTEEYLFYGFLPRKKKERQAEMQRLAKLKGTVLMYESPYRLKDTLDRKSTRLNSSHVSISYAVFCLKKKNQKPDDTDDTDLEAGAMGARM